MEDKGLFEKGNRHNYLYDLALKLKGAGVSKEDTNSMIVGYSKENRDDEDRSYIADLVFEEGNRLYIFTSRDDEDVEVIAALWGPVGVSLSYVKQLFAEHYPEDVQFNTHHNRVETVKTKEFFRFLCELGWEMLQDYAVERVSEWEETYVPARGKTIPIEQDDED